ncbi:MAG: hypothetical protein GF311_15565 [Candidatus Lokiarchaeota archaeon]|nr:hypothetical protein [Candidatus Lokiarchaeota archaeon]
MAFFFGAGISVEANVPNLEQLTRKISESLQGNYKENFKLLSKESRNFEDILDLIRHLKVIKEFNEEILAEKFKNIDYKDLDRKICSEIINQINPDALNPEAEKNDELNLAINHINFIKWLKKAHNNHYPPVEIYTTNYDIFLELAMDYEQVPYTDGFLGAYRPFFRDRLIFLNQSETEEDIPRSWFRYWKLHGSINWRQKYQNGKQQIFRTNYVKDLGEAEECLIQPSYFKFAETRLAPFSKLIDRFRRFLLSGERSLFINGFGFGDDHLNEIILQSIRENPNLVITIFDYGEENQISSKIKEIALDNHNFMVIGPDSYIWQRQINTWEIEAIKESNCIDYFEGDYCRLGKFSVFTSYLKVIAGIVEKNQEVEEDHR